MEPPRKDLLEERGGRIDPMLTPDSPIDDDERVDEAIVDERDRTGRGRGGRVLES